MSAEVDFVNKKEVHLRTLKQSGHVGFDSLPDQLVNKSVQNGFVFNVMCIGVYTYECGVLYCIYVCVCVGVYMRHMYASVCVCVPERSECIAQRFRLTSNNS